jgi:hypothetical protein
MCATRPARSSSLRASAPLGHEWVEPTNSAPAACHFGDWFQERFSTTRATNSATRRDPFIYI